MTLPFAQPEEIIADKNLIRKMIPYDESIIFLDKVSFSRKQKTYKGEFLVREQHCGRGGHKIGNKLLLFRAVDLGEMASQFLAVIYGCKHPKFAENKIGVLREVEKIKTIKQIQPGSFLTIKISQENVRDKNLKGPEEDQVVVILSGKDFSFWAEEKKKSYKVAYVKSVSLAIASV